MVRVRDNGSPNHPPASAVAAAAQTGRSDVLGVFHGCLSVIIRRVGANSASSSRHTETDRLHATLLVPPMDSYILA